MKDNRNYQLRSTIYAKDMKPEDTPSWVTIDPTKPIFAIPATYQQKYTNVHIMHDGEYMDLHCTDQPIFQLKKQMEDKFHRNFLYILNYFYWEPVKLKLC